MPWLPPEWPSLLSERRHRGAQQPRQKLPPKERLGRLCLRLLSLRSQAVVPCRLFLSGCCLGRPRRVLRRAVAGPILWGTQLLSTTSS